MSDLGGGRTRPAAGRRTSRASSEWLRDLAVPLFLTASLTLTTWWLLVQGARRDDAVAQQMSHGRAPALRYGDATVVDSSGQGHDGLEKGETVRGVAGHRGTAFYFAGRGAWVEVLPDDQLNPGRRDFLVSAFVRVPRAPEARGSFDIVRKGVSFSPGGEFKLEIVMDGHVRCTVKDSAQERARITSSTDDVADGQWHHVGCARVGPTWTVLVDREITTSEQPLGAVANDEPLAIGSKYGEEDVPNGSVDEVTLYAWPRETGQQLRGGDDPVGPPGVLAEVEEQIEQLSARVPVAHWALDDR